MTAPTQTGPGTPGSRMSTVYFDAANRRRHSRIEVPVNTEGEINGRPFECPRCHDNVPPTWKPLNYSKLPVCSVHPGQRMRPHVLKSPPLLPYRQIWDVCEKPLRPMWALPGMAAAGLAVDAANIPAWGVAAAVPVAFEATRRTWRMRAIRNAIRRGDLEAGDDVYGRRLRDAIDAAARKAGYVAAGGTGWLAAVAALGLDPSTTAGSVAWLLALLPWAPPAATYLKSLRTRPAAAPHIAETQAAEPEPQVDKDEQRILHIWRTVVAQHVGDIIGMATDGTTPIKATGNGKLPGAQLVGWQKIRGGWKATIVGPPGVFDSDAYLAAKKKIASAYSVTAAMVSLVPDGEDENKCELLVQKTSVIKEVTLWTGPESVDATTGLAPFVRYVDGSYGMYELYRPGWGSPHELFIGTTGAAKSSALELAFAIGRWAQHEGRGIVADFLIDPQEGQSFGAFADDLAAPVASTADEAMMLVRAFRREMLRRNKYLSHKKWTDGRGRQRRGVKWWNPLVEGPMLFLTIDEAHEFLAIREFAALVTAGGRMFRKCGMKLRIATHTPLLTDLGGSMALRDMLTGGFVWCGRTANSLSGPTAFNGRLPADPKFIPEVPGAAYILSAREKKPMLSRTMCGPFNENGEPDLYDYIRDGDNQPIGFPGVLPAETLAAFGKEYADWVEFMGNEHPDDTLWIPDADAAAPVKADRSDEFLHTMVWWALEQAEEPLDMNGLDAALRGAEVDASVLAVRDVLNVLRGQGKVTARDGRYELSPQARAEQQEKLREAMEQVERIAELSEAQ
ncbi:hypothetical protein AB0F72_08865 [Actinoplanes sp. NPDC023936]|uniref:hypothetical protein n=1 Tax=Actinoplanes sp. NPDC023936 TaxID=3154910 RepID=UPI00340DD88D